MSSRLTTSGSRTTLTGVVRRSVEEMLNGLLEPAADRLCNAQRYERTEARRDTRAGHYERKLQTKAGEERLMVPSFGRRPSRRRSSSATGGVRARSRRHRPAAIAGHWSRMAQFWSSWMMILRLPQAICTPFWMRSKIRPCNWLVVRICRATNLSHLHG